MYFWAVGRPGQLHQLAIPLGKLQHWIHHSCKLLSAKILSRCTRNCYACPISKAAGLSRPVMSETGGTVSRTAPKLLHYSPSQKEGWQRSPYFCHPAAAASWYVLWGQLVLLAGRDKICASGLQVSIDASAMHCYLVFRTTSFAAQNLQDLFACCWCGWAKAASKLKSGGGGRRPVGWRPLARRAAPRLFWAACAGT